MGGSSPAGSNDVTVTAPRTITNLSPMHTPSKFTNMLAGRLMYSQLSGVTYDMERENDLATSWEAQNDDLSEWVVELRDDATFHHNGETVQAKDVVATYTTIIENDLPPSGSLGGVESVEEVDSSTVEFTLSTGNADFPVFGAKGWASIVPKSAIENDIDSISTTDYGSGPFILESFPSENELVLKRNPDYYGTDSEGNSLPLVDTLTFKTITDNSTAITQLQNRETDIDRRTDISQMSRVEGLPNVEQATVTGGSFKAFVMKTSVEPFSDNRVRRAMKLGIDRQEFVDSVLQGHGQVANDSIIAPFFPFHNDLPQRERDVDRAQELLADAGYPDGFHLTEDFDITFYTPGQPATQLNSAILFQEQLREIGVEMEIEQLSYDQYVSEVWGQAPAYCGSYGTKFNENSLVSRLLHSDGPWWSENEWENDEKDQIIEDAARTTDEETRQELYGRLQELEHEEGAYIIPFFENLTAAQGEWVNDWQRHPIRGQGLYEQVSVDGNNQV
ncbi:ABC transporter substrate-binding protein [Natronorubrum sp. FCH18a]|uniref:ABC transporter substrate-binding protein n=1 Tax=Natronorubrum sp. FCH18a TaxID=3447018 RepID=UPI003F5151BA